MPKLKNFQEIHNRGDNLVQSQNCVQTELVSSVVGTCVSTIIAFKYV